MISIIIPTLNEEKVIGKTLSDLKTALTIPHEIIVSDGKSSDKTIEIAKSIADKVIEHYGDKRQKISEGRNAGAKAATGDFLVFMDADVSIRCPDDFFARLEKRFADDPRLVAVNTAIRVLPKNETIADMAIYAVYNAYIALGNNLFGSGMAAGEFIMVRRSVFEKIGGFDDSLVTYEDFDLVSRLSRLGKVRTVWTQTAFHTGRRAHKVGWPRLLYQWNKNFWNYHSVKKLGRHYIKEWDQIR